VTGSTGPIGPTGPSTAINASNDTSTTVLYPVMVGAAGSNQTPKVRTTAQAFIFNASSNTLTVNNLTVANNFTVDGTTTTLNTRELTVDDKNIELGSVIAKTGLVATLATGTNSVTLTTGNTSGVIPGQVLTKTSGTGVFGTGARVGAISSATVFTVVNAAGAALNHVTAGSITFTIEGASDASAAGGGITLKGTTDKTIIWNNSNAG
jgi:hypothetical protein